MKAWKRILAAALACAALAAGAAALAAGSADDPLVSLGYLEKIFTPTVYSKVDEAVKENEAALKADLDQTIDAWDKKLQEAEAEPSEPEQPKVPADPASFKTVTLRMSQTLVGEMGCELMLRDGAAVCLTAESVGLIDSTGGTALNNGGALSPNHLYLVAAASRSVKAASDGVKLLVRGSYTVQ